MNIKSLWIIDHPLTLKEREAIFILAQSAEIPIFGSTRINIDFDKFPCLMFNGNYIVGGTLFALKNEMRTHVKYGEVINSLKSIINGEGEDI